MRSDYTLGFLGAGNMASAILLGIINAGLMPPSRVMIYDINAQAMENLRHTGVAAAQTAEQLVAQSDMIIVAVKPDVMDGLLSELGSLFDQSKALLSIVTGWSVQRIRSFLHHSCPVVRVMPNTPAMVGQGMTAIARDDTLPTDIVDAAVAIFSSAGKVELVKEALMEAVTSVSGSGPAYAYQFIEALADGGVMQGLPRDVAMRLAAQTLIGAAAMVQTSGMHPGALKDAVCSPGGTTIEAIYALEQSGFRGAVMAAVDACAQKARVLAKDNA